MISTRLLVSLFGLHEVLEFVEPRGSGHRLSATPPERIHDMCRSTSHLTEIQMDNPAYQGYGGRQYTPRGWRSMTRAIREDTLSMEVGWDCFQHLATLTQSFLSCSLPC